MRSAGARPPDDFTSIVIAGESRPATAAEVRRITGAALDVFPTA